jgi:hypothetical protein
MMHSFIPARQVIAAAIMFALPIGAVEAGVGEARDGQVHHEDVTDATIHHDGQGSTGDHGHEDESAESPTEHGRDHQHGTSVDHCTHVHAPVMGAAPTSVPQSLECGALVFATVVAEQLAHFPVLIEPPRA